MKLWFRVGMEADVSEEFFNKLVDCKKNGDMEAVAHMIETMINYSELSGETYIVGKTNGGVDNYDNPDEEISVLF